MTDDANQDRLSEAAKRPASATPSDLRVRSWVLLVLDAASRNGITPLSKTRFHRLAYLTNALAPIYSLRAADERIVKHTRGQFYPVLQWHLDRLAAQSVVILSGVRHFVDADGAWMDADYKLSRAAVPILDRLMGLDEIRRISDFLLEVTKAYASQDDEALDDLILADVTYNDARRARGAVIDLGDARENLSVRTADSFGSNVRDRDLITMSDRVHLYVEYMDRVWLKRRAV